MAYHEGIGKKHIDHSKDHEEHHAHWIAGAIKHPGALHRALGIPEGHKIPESKLNAAAHSSNPTMRRRANLAKTLKGMHH